MSKKLYINFELSDKKPETVFTGNIILKRLPGGGTEVNIPQKLVYHSPCGFEWGYEGSGPADLALNILVQFTDEKTAFELHQDFKNEFVAYIPREGGVISRDKIINWIEEKTKPEEPENQAVSIAKVETKYNAGLKKDKKDLPSEKPKKEPEIPIEEPEKEI
jgi:hypothetical protein